MRQCFKDYKDVNESDLLINASLKELLENKESASIDDFEDDEVKEYIDSIKQYPKLSKREVFVLTLEYHNGSEDAFQRLVTCNLYLVIDVIKRYTNLGIDTMDLIQEGNIGLMEAIKNYKPEIAYTYTGFYQKGISYHISRYINNKSRLIRITDAPSSYFRRVFNYKEKQKMIGRNITDGVACKELGINYRTFKSYLKTYAFIQDVISLDEKLDDETYVKDVLIDHSLSFEERAEYSTLGEILSSVLQESLTDKQRKVICLRYGFVTGKEESLEYVGKEFNNTRERVKQVEWKALRKLRMDCKCLEGYL